MTDTTHDFDTRTFATGARSIVGRVDGDVVRVLGIPYAIADRFERPRPFPVDESADPFLAFDRAPASPQLSSPVLESLLEGGSDGMTADENCQRLSITTPVDVDPSERLPVMVWIHGGAYVTGGGDLDAYDPRALVEEQRVIVVTVTYRLGMLGFFGDGDGVPANLGLLDVIEALRWIHSGIASFGGDPDLVTLFGQSAGGDAIAHLMISEGTRGLFRRVIIQSAPLGISAGRSKMLKAMAVATGTPSREGPVDAVLALQGRADRAARRFGLKAGMPFGTQYGQEPLPAEGDRDAAWRAVAPFVDVLIGSNTDETGMYLPFVPGARALQRAPVIGRLLSALVVAPTTFGVYGRDVRRFARRHREARGRAMTYSFAWGPEAVTVGSVHMSELPLLLGTRESWERTTFVGRHNTGALDGLGRILRSAWAEFARTGTIAAATERELHGTLTLGR